MTQRKGCVYEMCLEPRSERLKAPLCSRHAQQVYLEVRDLMRNATNAEREAAIPRRTSPGLMADDHYSKREGFVYFAECDDLIKIGFSTNVRQRMRQLGARLLCAIPGTVSDEKAMQARFGPHWVDGEYFRRSPEILRFIEEHRAGAA